jgi:hypothetical protein
MDELEEEMSAQRHKELMQKFFAHMQTVYTSTVELAKEINDSTDLPQIFKDMFSTILIGLLGVLRDDAQVLDLLNTVLGAGMANMKHNHPDAAWVDRELEGIQDVLGDKRPGETA